MRPRRLFDWGHSFNEVRRTLRCEIVTLRQHTARQSGHVQHEDAD